MLMLVGGPSQLDTWDMKPDAPAEIRGPYKAIPTNVAGIQISEIFPRMAKHADKYALLRSVYHTGAGVHDVGHQYMQTGRFFQFGNEQPHFGCVLSKLKGPKGDAPPHVLLPRPIGNTGGNLPHGQNAGFLGKTFDPFVLNADPSDANFQVPDLLSPDYLPPMRVDGRSSMRQLVDKAVSHLESVPDARLLDSNFQSAYRLMSSESAREAFDLSKEDDKTKERYGRNRFGMSCLLARRMIERGVRFVTVNMFETVFNEITWDIHGSAPFSPIELLSRPRRPDVRPRLQLAARGPARSRAAAEHAGPRDGRVRPHAEGEPRGRPRSLDQLLDDADGRRRHQGRAGHRRVRRDRRRIRRTGRSRRPMSPRPIYKALGIDIETPIVGAVEPAGAGRRLRPSPDQ